jgi:hypothetical protein
MRVEPSPEHTKEASMGPKLIVALILSIIVFTIEPTRPLPSPSGSWPLQSSS